MRVQNMVSARGNSVPNQFIITEEGRGALGNFTVRKTFQSYNSIIAVVTVWPDEARVELDRDTWDYSATTSKYRNAFLDCTSKECKQRIASGEYVLADLNR